MIMTFKKLAELSNDKDVIVNAIKDSEVVELVRFICMTFSIVCELLH